MSSRGFTLVEVVVAMLVLEVGLLGVVGTLLLATRTVRRAELMERVVTEAQALYDSAAAKPVVGSGARTDGLGAWHWSVGADGAFALDVLTPDDSVLLALRGRLPVQGPG